MSFKIKSADEVAKLNEVELASYMTDLQAHKQVELKEAMKSELKDEVSKLKQEMIEIQDKRTNLITKSLEKQANAIEKLSNKGSVNLKQEDETEIKKRMKSLKDTGSGRVKFKSMTLGVNAPTYSQGQVENMLTRLPERRPYLQQIFNSASLTEGGKVIYFEQSNRVGDANFTGEGLAKATTDFDIVEVTENAKKVTNTIKVSTEMLEDIPFMESEIRNELVSRIALKVDSQLMSGTGAGAQLKGILQNAQAFSAGSFATSIPDANNFDVLRIAIQQVMSNDFMPNYILLNPADVAGMDLSKASDGHYVMPRFAGDSGQSISGVPILVNNGVAVGDYVVLDSTKVTVYTKNEVNVTVGYENDDFTKNMVTVLGEWRGASVIKSNNYGAIVSGTFATDITAIKKL